MKKMHWKNRNQLNPNHCQSNGWGFYLFFLPIFCAKLCVFFGFLSIFSNFVLCLSALDFFQFFFFYSYLPFPTLSLIPMTTHKQPSLTTISPFFSTLYHFPPISALHSFVRNFFFAPPLCVCERLSRAADVARTAPNRCSIAISPRAATCGRTVWCCGKSCRAGASRIQREQVCVEQAFFRWFYWFICCLLTFWWGWFLVAFSAREILILHRRNEPVLMDKPNDCPDDIFGKTTMVQFDSCVCV